jgi:hypothetical protein
LLRDDGYNDELRLHLLRDDEQYACLLLLKAACFTGPPVKDSSWPVEVPSTGLFFSNSKTPG